MMMSRTISSPRRWVCAAAMATALILPGSAFGDHHEAGETAAAGEAVAEKVDLGTPEEKEEVRARVQDYWDARIKREQRVMTFYAPPEKGGPEGLADVSEFGNLTYKEVEIQDVQVGSNWANVTLRVRLSLVVGNVHLPKQAEYATITERWNRIDGTWYKKPIPPGLRPTGGRAKQEREKKKEEYLSKVQELQAEYARDAAEGTDATSPTDETGGEADGGTDADDSATEKAGSDGSSNQ